MPAAPASPRASQRKYVKPTKPLTAEMIAVLLIMEASDKALLQIQVERVMKRRGAGVSIADAVDYLETVAFIRREQPPPKTAKFIITDEGEWAIDVHQGRAVRELEAKIAKMQKPHPRDESVLTEDIVSAYQGLLELIRGEQRPAAEEETESEEESAPDPVLRPIRSASAPRTARTAQGKVRSRREPMAQSHAGNGDSVEEIEPGDQDNTETTAGPDDDGVGTMDEAQAELKGLEEPEAAPRRLRRTPVNPTSVKPKGGRVKKPAPAAQ